MNIREMLGGELPEFPVIDMHAHMDRCGQFMCPGDPGIEGMLRVMDRVGVDRIAIAPNMAINCDITEGNRRVLKAAEKHPDRVIGLCTVNFNRFEESLRTLDECFATPYFKGIKLHPNFMDYFITDEKKMNTVLDYARENHAFLISHTDARQYPGCLEPNSAPKDFEPYGKSYPDVNFIIAHCGLTPEGYRDTERLAIKYRNVFLDTTGFRFSNFWTVERCAKTVGSDQLVFGTDMPFNDVGSGLCRVVLADLPLETKLKMLGGNAMRLMGEA